MPRHYQLAELKTEEFLPVPSSNYTIAKSLVKIKTKGPDSEILRNISWYKTKLLVQSLGHNYALPASSQWNTAKEYFKNDPKLRIVAWDEWVDSLIALPNERGEYSPRLQILGIGKGKLPLLIQQSEVEKVGTKHVLTKGKITELPNLPLKSGYVNGWDEELGLPTKVGKEPNENFGKSYVLLSKFANYSSVYDYNTGLRAVTRKWETGKQFEINASWSPTDSDWSKSFRLIRVNQ